MRSEKLQQLVEAVLYEGHILYPYRASARKNRQQSSFGRVYPDAYAASQEGREPWALQTQCLLRVRQESASVEIHAGFLQPLARDIGVLTNPRPAWSPTTEPPFEVVPVFELEGQLYQSWQEATERAVHVVFRPLSGSHTVPFSFSASRTLEPVRNAAGSTVAVIIRHQPALRGELELSCKWLGDGLRCVTLRIVNVSPISQVEIGDMDAVLARTFASTHAILKATAADFISLTNPPADCAQAVVDYQKQGLWPVLVGDEAAHDSDTVLAAPIKLPDYPQAAPENPQPLRGLPHTR